MGRKNQWVRREIRKAQKDGIPVYIDGVKCPSDEERARSVIREEADYMSDYVSNESGKIIELNFNRINRKR